MIWGACGSPTDGVIVTSASSSSGAIVPDVPGTVPAPDVVALQGALHRARASSKLVLVDVWAPWCAPCAVFKREVLTQENRTALADRVEIVELDLDHEETAPFSERYGVLPLPSLLVLDPKDGSVLAQRSGLMSFADLEALIGVAGKTTDAARTTLAKARALRDAGDKREAAELFKVVAGVTNGATREEALVAALDLFREAGDPALCADVAREAIDRPGLAGRPTRTFWLALLQAHLVCSLSIEIPHERAPHLAWLLASARFFEEKHRADLDGRTLADLHGLMSLIATERGDAKAARMRDEARLTAIDRAIGDAKDQRVAASFDPDRTSTLLALGREDDAIAALRARAVALPSNYEVHGRLGTTLVRVGKHAESMDPLTRAIDLAYGAPKFIYMHRLADAYVAVGDKEKARDQLRRAMTGWVSLPESQRDPARMAAVDRALNDLDRTP